MAKITGKHVSEILLQRFSGNRLFEDRFIIHKDDPIIAPLENSS